jgi:hypothetical protein
VKIKALCIVIFISILLSFNAAHGLMVKLSYEQIWTEADTVVSGRVVEINHYWALRGLIYRIMKMQTENFYKNPLDVDSLLIRVEGGQIGEKGTWVEDEPELKIGEHVLLFLTLTSEEHENESVYIVYGGPQGKFVFKENRVNNGDIYLDINEDSITYRPGGESYLVETNFDDPIIANVTHRIYLTLGNDGPQPDWKYFNVTYVGAEGSAIGRNVTKIFRGGADPGKYSGFDIDVKLAEPGVYVMLVDGVSFGNVTVVGGEDQSESETESIQEPEQEPEPESETEQRGIPGFPYIAMILGLVIVMILRDRIHY